MPGGATVRRRGRNKSREGSRRGQVTLPVLASRDQDATGRLCAWRDPEGRGGHREEAEGRRPQEGGRTPRRGQRAATVNLPLRNRRGVPHQTRGVDAAVVGARFSPRHPHGRERLRQEREHPLDPMAERLKEALVQHRFRSPKQDTDAHDFVSRSRSLFRSIVPRPVSHHAPRTRSRNRSRALQRRAQSVNKTRLYRPFRPGVEESSNW